MIYLDLEDFRKICYEYAKARLTFNEPLPSFETRFAGKLESALAAPQQTFGGKELYPTIAEKGAVLFYELAKGQHPFMNGNKRLTVVGTMVFFALNNKWVEADWITIYNKAKEVADSEPKQREVILQGLVTFIQEHIVDMDVFDVLTKMGNYPG